MDSVIVTMRNYLLGATALTMLAGSPAVAADLFVPGPGATLAEPQWDAFFSAGGGYVWGAVDDLDLLGEMDDFAAEVRSTAAFQLDNGFGVQGDLVFKSQGLGIPDLDLSATNTDVAGHAFYRSGDFLVGAFGQYGVSSMDMLPLDIDTTYFGAEAQAYLDRFTLYVQGGYQSQDWGVPDAQVAGYFLTGEGRYFVTDNLKLNLEAGLSTLDLDGDFTSNTVTLGAGVEYRFDDLPISTFLTVDHSITTYSDAADFSVTDTRLLAGVKLNLGTDTLFARDRAGASLDPVRTAPIPAFFMLP